MAACLTELEWRREAARMVVLIADAPPHGIGESGDRKWLRHAQHAYTAQAS